MYPQYTNSKNYFPDEDLIVITEENRTLMLSETVWEDLRFPITAVKLGGVNDPDFVQFTDNGESSTGVFTLAFDKAAEEEVFFIVQLQHSYKLGTNLRPHIHWGPSVIDTGNCVWGLEYTIANINDTFGNTNIINATQAGSGIVKKHQIVSFPEISGRDIDSVSSMLLCRLFRDATNELDTFNGDAYLFEVDLHYQIDTLGSRQEIKK